MVQRRTYSNKTVAGMLAVVVILLAPVACNLEGIDEDRLEMLRQKYGRVYAAAHSRGPGGPGHMQANEGRLVLSQQKGQLILMTTRCLTM